MPPGAGASRHPESARTAFPARGERESARGRGDRIADNLPPALVNAQGDPSWPLVCELSAAGPPRLEIGPGRRPRLPIAGTYCIEISRAALSRLVRHGGIAAQTTAEALPSPDAVFDLVMAMDIIEPVDDEPISRELARVLRPGGTLVLSSPPHDDVVGHLRPYQPQELLAQLARHGLTVEQSAIYGMQTRSRARGPRAGSLPPTRGTP